MFAFLGGYFYGMRAAWIRRRSVSGQTGKDVRRIKRRAGPIHAAVMPGALRALNQHARCRELQRDML
jgi:hypothetical protein